MKLQLKTNPEAAILSVQESVGPDDVVVLRAGLGKLAAQGKQAVVLDLLAASFSQPAALAQLRGLPEALQAGGGMLLLAMKEADESRPEEFKTVEDALKHFTDPDRRTEHEIRLYTAWNNAIEARRKTLETEIKSGGGKDQEAGRLRTSISQLRRRIRFLEQRVATWMSKPPYRGATAASAPSSSPASPSLDRIMEILGQAGILKGILTASPPTPQAAGTAPTGAKP